MRFLKLTATALTCFAAAATTSHATAFEPTVTETFTNPDCAANQTCSLKSFSVETKEYRVTFSDGTYALGKAMNARYRTDSNKTLRDFAIVQFIRGCAFESQLKNGVVTKWIGTSRVHFGRNIPFKHPAWVADTMTTDPVYWSEPLKHKDRQYNYLWNKRRGSDDERTAVLFGMRQPPTPELYISDDPSGASLLSITDFETMISNISLEFSTCIYRTEDVPATLEADELPKAEALHCSSWSFSKIFNYETHQFDSPQGIDPFCEAK